MNNMLSEQTVTICQALFTRTSWEHFPTLRPPRSSPRKSPDRHSGSLESEAQVLPRGHRLMPLQFKLMGWMAPSRHLSAKMVVVEDHQ